MLIADRPGCRRSRATGSSGQGDPPSQVGNRLAVGPPQEAAPPARRSLRSFAPAPHTGSRKGVSWPAYGEPRHQVAKLTAGGGDTLPSANPVRSIAVLDMLASELRRWGSRRSVQAEVCPIRRERICGSSSPCFLEALLPQGSAGEQRVSA